MPPLLSHNLLSSCYSSAPPLPPQHPPLTLITPTLFFMAVVKTQQTDPDVKKEPAENHQTLSRPPLTPRLSRIQLLLLLICTLLYLLLVHPRHTLSPLFQSARAKGSNRASGSLKTLVIQRGGHYVSTDATVNSYSELFSAPDETNVGNFVWQAGGLALIDRQTDGHIYCQGDREDCVNNHPTHARIVHYIPSSYMLADARMAAARHTLVARMEALTANMSTFGEPFLFVGIGTQSSFSADAERNDFGMADAIANTPEDYTLVDEGVRMLRKLHAMNMPVFFRGAFSSRVANLAGLARGIDSGCPSLMLNKKVRLGDVLQGGYDGVSARVGDRSLRVAVNLAAGMPKLRKWYLGIMERYPNSVLFLQSRKEALMFQKGGIPFERIRYYPQNVERWVQNLTTMDVAIGSRIHGSMAALAAAIPLYIVAPDFRVLEMAQAMGIPHTNMYDIRLRNDSLDIAELFRDIAFDGNRFDENRCRIANIYQTQLGQFGIHLAPHVQQIAQIC